MPKLYVLSSPDVGRSFALADGATVGRDPSCAIVLRDASISRKHARFELADGAWRVVDTGSRNGLHRAGARVESLALADGLEFTLGEVELRFRDAAAVEQAKTSNAPSPTPGGAPPASASAPAPSAPARAPAPADEPDEIVLEGAWDEPRAPAPPRASVSAPPPELERTQLRAPLPFSSASTSTPAPRTDAPQLAPATPIPPHVRPGVTARAPVAGQGGAAASRAVLQYQRVHDDGRALNADLAQLPVWMKLAIAVLALALFAGVGWIAFQGTSFFKGKLHGADDPAAGEGETDTAPDER
jgi:predicted component of type VI protein secretion system